MQRVVIVMLVACCLLLNGADAWLWSRRVTVRCDKKRNQETQAVDTDVPMPARDLKVTMANEDFELPLIYAEEAEMAK